MSRDVFLIYCRPIVAPHTAHEMQTESCIRYHNYLENSKVDLVDTLLIVVLELTLCSIDRYVANEMLPV